MSPTFWSSAANGGKKHRSHIVLVINIFMCAVVVAAIFFIPEVGMGVQNTLSEALHWAGLVLVPFAAGFLILFAVWLGWRARDDREDGRPVRNLAIGLIVFAAVMIVVSVFLHSAR
ncbi:MAG TPA: hypothetical protein VF281_00430 [Candidatus Saccharimonadales bacterium]